MANAVWDFPLDAAPALTTALATPIESSATVDTIVWNPVNTSAPALVLSRPRHWVMYDGELRRVR